MARILFAWELGSGLGHMAPCRGLFEKLCARGHSLTLVLRDLSRAKRIFDGLNVSLLQAPIKFGLPSSPEPASKNYSYILHSVGFEDVDELESLTAAWRSTYALVRPDLVLADHSPIAMLALRGLPIRVVALGCGFLIPPDTVPLQNFSPWQSFDEAQARRDDAAMLNRINTVLNRFAAPPLERIGQLFSDADDRVLTTFPELDHYPKRKNGTYWGLRGTVSGADFDWPVGSGPRIYCYLRPSPEFHVILQALNDLKHPTIVSSDSIPSEMQQQFTTPQLRFENRLLNLEQILKECALAVVNGSHEMSGAILLAGKPILCIPLTVEKKTFAIAVQRLGAGLFLEPDQPRQFTPKLATMLSSDSYTKAAQRLAARYAKNDPSRLEDLLADRIEEILSDNWTKQRRVMPSPLQVEGEALTPVSI